MRKPIKIAVINSHPITYFAEMYQYINRDPNIELSAIYFSDMGVNGTFDRGFNQSVSSTVDILEGYNPIFCGKNYKNKSIYGFFSLICPEIWGVIRRSHYDVIWFHGYNYLAYVIAFIAAATSNKKILFRSETHLKLHRNPFKRILRDTFLRLIFKKIDGFLAIGQLNKEYYNSCGVADDKIFLVPYAINNHRFALGINHKAQKRKSIEKTHGTSKKILFCAKFISRKNPHLLVNAAKILEEKGYNFQLIMAGNGPLLESIKRRTEQLKLKNVLLKGFVDQKSLPELFSECDLFVHPSKDEPWGLVVNEAMAAGLPVIVGGEMGCARDLVRDGENGYSLDHYDESSLANLIETILSDTSKMKKMAKASEAIINNWSYKQCHSGLKLALQHIII